MQVPSITHKGLSFINLNGPKEDQLRFLNKNFGFSMLNLEDYLYKTQIPKIEIYKDYSLLVMDIPFIAQMEKSKGNSFVPQVLSSHVPFKTSSRSARKKRINVGEVDFFIGKDYIVVLHDSKTPQIDELFDMCKVSSKHREEFMEKGSSFLFYRLVDVLVDSAFSYVEDISNAIDYIDNQLDENSTARVIEDISITRRNIVVFETMIKPALPIFADLEKGKYKELNGEMTPYWSNILDHLQKIWERLEDHKELIQGISSSHESILSNRSNELVKFFTLVTAVAFPFVLVNNLYSMNVMGLPYAEKSWIVWILFLLAFTGGGLVLAYFKYRDWL